MEGLYRVVEVAQATGLLHLEKAGGRRFRVRLGPRALAGFAVGMKVQLRRSKNGGLVLEAKGPARQAAPAGREAGAGSGQRRRDRRRAPRAGFAGPVTVTAQTGAIRCSARDVSEGGIALRLPKQEQLEGPLELAFKLPSDQRLLKVGGVAVRVSRTPTEGVWGVGFRGVPPDVAQALNAFVATSGGDAAAEPRRSRLDRDLAAIYQDAIAGLGPEPARRR